MTKATNKTILLAEDDASISEVMTIILEEAGYEVVVAKNKRAIADVWKKQLPSLIFLDVRLGGENGEDIARDLLGKKETATIPLIIVSADEQTHEIAKRVGARGFLQKPFDMDVLLNTVQKHLQ